MPELAIAAIAAAGAVILAVVYLVLGRRQPGPPPQPERLGPFDPLGTGDHGPSGDVPSGDGPSGEGRNGEGSGPAVVFPPPPPLRLPAPQLPPPVPLDGPGSGPPGVSLGRKPVEDGPKDLGPIWLDADPPDDDRWSRAPPLDVRGYTPAAVDPGRVFTCRVSIFTEGLTADADQRAKRIVSPSGTLGVVAGQAVLVPDGQTLMASCALDGASARLLSDPVQLRQLPDGPVDEFSASFDFMIEVVPQPIEGTIRAEVSIFVGPLLVAILNPTTMVGEGGADVVAHPSTPLDSVFASYSRRDAPVVDAISAACRSLGISLFVDTESLASGDDWQREIRRRIDRADVFQLFWSPNAARSEWVDREWRHALHLTEQGTKRGRFIRPFCWDRSVPELPEDLGHLHMTYVPDLVRS